MAKSNLEERYRRLGIRESLAVEHRYPTACRDLSFILRGAYDRLPKHLKSLVFHDTSAAFRLLPEMKAQSAVSAATLLVQAAEAALPKQKKNLAVSEFKRAKIAYKKHCKIRQESSDSVQLPHDVLLHIFSFLDFQSIMSASLVCWAWNVAGNDNSVWQSVCRRTFVARVNDEVEREQDKHHGIIRKDKKQEAPTDWKEIFRRMHLGKTHKRLFTSDRGYCRLCKSIVWLNNLACPNPHIGSKSTSNDIKRVSQQRVVDYILCDSSSDSDSDTGSDSDTCGQAFDCGNDEVHRLWAYPRCCSRGSRQGQYSLSGVRLGRCGVVVVPRRRVFASFKIPVELIPSATVTSLTSQMPPPPTDPPSPTFLEDAEEDDSLFELDISPPHSPGNTIPVVRDKNLEDDDRRYSGRLKVGTFQQRLLPATSSPADKSFSKRKVLPIEGLYRPQSPISLLKSAPKFSVFMFAKSKSTAVSKEEAGKKQDRNRGSTQLAWNFKPNVIQPFLTRSGSLRKESGDDSPCSHAPGDPGASRRFSRDVIHKYLRLVKPLYTKSSKKRADGEAYPEESPATAALATPPFQAGNGKPPLAQQAKQFGKSRSVSTGTARVDDSLLQHHDGIESAILHCKRSFSASRDFSPETATRR
ncbi:hypothetical protein MLD38_015680 [Melastoma candidum]|uniref:Uncharacterized protein n=1 Tax=Melastoma candidum TaxID=119954 RepID=A0ACB9RI36_9MYRT|nr:hypothetical protein MLD38_015680 [Melastoma candidum]